MTSAQRSEYRRQIDLMANKEDLEAVLRGLKAEDSLEETHDLAEEALMTAGARGIEGGA